MFRSKLNSSIRIYYRIGKRFKWTSEKCALFENLFELSEGEFRKYKIKNKIPLLSDQHLISNAAFCNSIGAAKDDWLKFPSLVKSRSKVLEQHYLHLKEGGFTSVGPEILVKYRKCVKKKVQFLKEFNFIPKDTNVAESFISYLYPRPTDMYIADLTDDNLFDEIHYAILTRYLMWKFEATEEEIQKFYRVNLFSNVKSFDFLCQNFVFLNELGYSLKKLMKHGYLLSNNPHSPKDVLDKFSRLTNIDLLEGMKVHPKLISTSLEKCIEIYKYLKELNIEDSVIRSYPGIFELSPSTIKLRVNEIKSVPELKLLLNDVRILKLIRCHNTSRSKLSFLQSIKMKCTPFRVIGGSNRSLKAYIEKGVDANSNSDVINLLNHLLSKVDDKIVKNLRKQRFYRNVPLVQIEHNYKLLQQSNFDNETIKSVVQILFYPSNKLKETYEKIQTMYPPETQITKVQQLNLIIYLIEKKHNFSGNGVWDNCEEYTDCVI